MSDDVVVRTTLDLDEDVLAAVKELAANRKSTAGKVLSGLAREALRPRGGAGSVRSGVPLLPQRSGERPVTPGEVNRLRDEV
jgi:hypothetical protein